MSFLGSVAKLNGVLVRPHDIRVGRTPDLALASVDRNAAEAGVLKARVKRVVYLGFEVRVELENAATNEDFHAQITRGDAAALGLSDGDDVYVRATRVPDAALT